MDQSAIRNPQSAIALPPPWRQVLAFGDLDSTQTEAARRLGAGEPMAGTVVRAERQLAGRGRRDHRWQSEAGGLYVTAGLPYELELKPADCGWISLLAALGAVEALREDWGFAAAIKWPNDLIVDGRKVGGLLGEVKVLPGGRRLILIGLGLNWTNAVDLADPAGASAPPGALAEFRLDLPAAGRDGFLLGWLERLNRWHTRLQAEYTQGLAMLGREVEAVLWRKNETVFLKHTERGPVQGRLLGLGSGGAARLEIAPAEVIEVHCGWQVER